MHSENLWFPEVVQNGRGLHGGGAVVKAEGSKLGSGFNPQASLGSNL